MNGRYAQADPSNGDLYIMEDLPEVDFQSENLKELAHYDSNLVPLERFGFGNLDEPLGFAINGSDGTAYVAMGTSIQRYESFAPPYKPVDSVAVDHGLHQAGVHSFEDFQVSPDGRYAAFSSPASLTGYPNEGRSEIYRYDADSGELDCVSCAESNASPDSDTKLTANGANLTDDGRVFFTTGEPLVLRDGNARTDVYEWTDGRIALVSTGLSADNSTLLSVGSDGVDAFFFTREALVPQDQNGSHVRLYDARAGGGYLYIPPPALCKASDECHGAGSPSPAQLDINTGSGVTPKAVKREMPEGQGQAARQVRAAPQAQAQAQAPSTSPLEAWRFKVSAVRKGLGVCSLAIAMTLGVCSAPALGAQEIESFSSTLSTADAGDHPDISTSFVLKDPGSPEGARNISFNAPEGVFGNPNAIPRCTAAEFAFQECSPSSQAGLITIYANYEGNPSYLLGTVPIYDIEPGLDQTALLGLNVPILEIPIVIPVTVRTADDYGLRFTVSNISQLTPLARADLTLWGFPAVAGHDSQRFPKGTFGEPAGCPESADTSCLAGATGAESAIRPFTDNPTTCNGEPLPVSLEVETYQDPGNVTRATSSYPPVTHCERGTFKPVLRAKPTSNRTDSASGLDIELRALQPLGFAVTPSEIQAATVLLPEGLTINPDAADGQTACTDAQANLDSEGPGECPDSAKIGTMGIHSTALDGTLTGSIYFGEPKPGDQYRIFMIVDGFGLHAKLIGSVKPDPATGQVSIFFTDLPQVPFDVFDVHIFASDRGLVATPIQCRIYHVEADFFPWNETNPPVRSNQAFALESGPYGAACPGETRPFDPRLAAGTTSPNAGQFTNFGLQLDRDDGDQFLGDLTFTMPPGLTGSLRGITYCPQSSIDQAVQNPGRVEELNPSCPASSQIGTTNVAAGPGGHPFHAVGCTLPVRSKARRCRSVAVTPALAGPYDYGTVVVRVALHVDPLDRPGLRGVRHGSGDHRRHSDPDALDPGQHRSGLTSRSTRRTARRSRSTSRGSATRGRSPTSRSTSTRSTARPCASSRRCGIRQIGGRKKTKRAQNPKLAIRSAGRGRGDANIKSLSVTLSKAFEIDQRHLGNICSEKELAEKQCAGRTPIGKAMDQDAAARQAASGPGLRGVGLGRPAAAGLHPQRPGQPGAEGRHQDRRAAAG